jgi:4'-phosphopantetheinyl transferase
MLWLPAPHQPTLGPHEVHLWLADLAAASAIAQELLPTLSPDERARAARFRFAQDRERFSAARGILRAILARYLAQPAAAIRFSYTPYGKPALAEHPAICFNLSHAGERAIYAVAQGRPLGVDIEHVRAELASATIAAQFFSAYEVQALGQLAPDDWEQAFFRCWTRKEAYVKARGLGLALALDQFDVTLAAGEAALLATRDDPAEAGRWTLYDPGLAPPYVGALAIAGPITTIRHWLWQAYTTCC